MKKLLGIMLVLLFWFNNAHSEWKYVGKSPDGDFYIDPETIANVDKTKFVWILHDSIDPDLGAVSKKIHVQFDCNIKRYKIYYTYVYKEAMGKGIVVADNNGEISNWISTPPGSILYEILKKIC